MDIHSGTVGGRKRMRLQDVLVPRPSSPVARNCAADASTQDLTVENYPFHQPLSPCVVASSDFVTPKDKKAVIDLCTPPKDCSKKSSTEDEIYDGNLYRRMKPHTVFGCDENCDSPPIGNGWEVGDNEWDLFQRTQQFEEELMIQEYYKNQRLDKEYSIEEEKTEKDLRELRARMETDMVHDLECIKRVLLKKYAL
jgi:hypothetical protein